MALMQEDVRKVREVAAEAPGAGGVVKVPVRLFERA